MNLKVLNLFTLEEWRVRMNNKGYDSKTYDMEELLMRSDKPCYIPDNATDIKDIMSYQDLKKQTIVFLNRIDYIPEKDDTIERSAERLVDNFFTDAFDLYSSYTNYLNDII